MSSESDWWDEIPREYRVRSYFPTSFPLSREAWEFFGLEEVLAGADLMSVPNPAEFVRRVAFHSEQVRRAKLPHSEPIQAGQLLAYGLLAEAFRFVFDFYWKEQNPHLLEKALEYAASRSSSKKLNHTIETFVEHFPPRKKADVHPKSFLEEETAGDSNRHLAARELLLLTLFHENPALNPLKIFFDDSALQQETLYRALAKTMEAFVEAQSPVDPLGTPLISTLRAPILAAPNSLEGQIEFIRTHWALILPKWLLRRLLAARDVIREETWMRGFGPGPVEVLRFGLESGEYGYPEPERFTADADWMSTVVIMAKVVYVWLDQLSKRYSRPIRRLDEIPDEELDRLARWGFSGLWLIGIWERSIASQLIKQRTGNPEAAASAYSLYDYIVAGDLGGEPALIRLRDRAAKRGLRLATDMVPNHVGIYSRWVMEHPDWFIQCKAPPFPGYRFTGPDLCPEDRVSIRIEDGYWDKRDAAVVFQRVDNWTGEVRYIYHGNDGTNMPWNDTAQLNYLLPEVREAVIQTILRVARDFPIIRFDAAMTLAKRHYQRLWFPLPGEGGAIPSRSTYSMTRAEFDAAMPEEFWRQVVDRVTAEAPDTLLLAEAFWLMEGYFVRTLGMHRVYNSAFMNMLKMEDNLKYRMTVKNVLEFSPEVLKRFVNFMNNPDELTAVEQFGKGDKYFGVAVMMVTMPGLPMFGHGQIEGFREKYGMEYRRAYWDEPIDEELVRRHEREIFPLMRRRRLFSGVEHFAFYDFIHRNQYVDENVFAYSNRLGNQRVIVIYNNSYNSTEGHIHTSTAINVGPAEAPQFIHRTLTEALGLRTDPNVFYIFKDHRENRYYIREGAQLERSGLYCVLQGYQYHVFLDFEEIVDTTGVWRKVMDKLNGAGTPDIRRVYREVLLSPTLEPLKHVFDSTLIAALAPTPRRNPRKEQRIRKKLLSAFESYLQEAENVMEISFDRDPLLEGVEHDVSTIQNIQRLLKTTRAPAPIQKLVLEGMKSPSAWAQLAVWAVLRHLEEVLSVSIVDGSTAWMHEWLIDYAVADVFQALGETAEQADQRTTLTAILVRHTPELMGTDEKALGTFFDALLEDETTRRFLRVNEYGGEWWLGKEQLEEALTWLLRTAAVVILGDRDLTKSQQNALLETCHRCIQTTIETAASCGYRIRSISHELREKDHRIEGR